MNAIATCRKSCGRIAFVGLFTIAPFLATADTTGTVKIGDVFWSYTLSDGAATITGVEPATGDIEVPADIEVDGTSYPVVKILKNAFKGDTEITSIIIPNSVTNIGLSAFNGCSSITNMVLPFVGAQRGNTGNSTALFGYVFGSTSYTGGQQTRQYYSSSYSTYYIPSSLKSVTITDETLLGYGAFDNCSMLEEVSLPSTLTTADQYAFRNCTGLEEITFLASLTNIANQTFYGCTSMKAVYAASLGQWLGFTNIDSGNYPLCYAHDLYIDGELLTDLVLPDGTTEIRSYAFAACTNIVSVVVPNSVTNIGLSAFSGCSSITNMVLPFVGATRGNTGNSTALFGYVFGSTSYTGCRSVQQWYGLYNNTYYNYYRYYCIPTSLKHVEITGETLLGYGAFCNCSMIETITLPSTLTQADENAFVNCTGLEAVCITNLAAWCGVGFANATANPLYYARDLRLDGVSVNAVTIGSAIASVGDWTFENCTNIQRVAILGTDKEISTNAFAGCTGVSTVFLPRNLEEDKASLFPSATLDQVYRATDLSSPAVFDADDVRIISKAKVEDSDEWLLTLEITPQSGLAKTLDASALKVASAPTAKSLKAIDIETAQGDSFDQDGEIKEKATVTFEVAPEETGAASQFYKLFVDIAD